MLIQAETILIVDDHPVVLDGLALMLQELRPNASIIKVLNAVEALQEIDAHKTFDWMFLDIHLPDISGLELLSKLRANKVLSNMIMLSSEISPEIMEEAFILNVNGILSKNSSRQLFNDCFIAIDKGNVFLTDEHSNELKYYRDSQLQEKQHIQQKISPRQIETLLMISKGYSNREISNSMLITESTVKSHVSKLMELLNADNRTHCVSRAQRLKLF